MDNKLATLEVVPNPSDTDIKSWVRLYFESINVTSKPLLENVIK